MTVKELFDNPNDPDEHGNSMNEQFPAGMFRFEKRLQNN